MADNKVYRVFDCQWTTKVTKYRTRITPMELHTPGECYIIRQNRISLITSMKVGPLFQYKCHRRFSFVLEDLGCFALCYGHNPEGTSDLLKWKKRLDFKLFLFPRLYWRNWWHIPIGHQLPTNKAGSSTKQPMWTRGMYKHYVSYIYQVHLSR